MPSISSSVSNTPSPSQSFGVVGTMVMLASTKLHSSLGSVLSIFSWALVTPSPSQSEVEVTETVILAVVKLQSS